jgi:mannose-6-phosphate isomerase-like protein (cupin superfamily)
MEKVNITEKFRLFEDFWNPKIIGELNGQYVKVVKIKGEFVWHHHDFEDELFWIIKGRMRMLLKDREVVLEPGEFFIVPRGVEHKPVADEEVYLLLFEPKSTLNTGDQKNERTVEELEWI